MTRTTMRGSKCEEVRYKLPTINGISCRNWYPDPLSKQGISVETSVFCLYCFPYVFFK